VDSFCGGCSSAVDLDAGELFSIQVHRFLFVVLGERVVWSGGD